MKLYISANPQIISGYTIFSPLDKICVNNSECIEIILDKAIEYIPYNHIQEWLQNIVLKMRHKCVLTINSYDAQEVSRCYFTGRISTQEYNKIMYGDQENLYKVSHVSMNEIIDLLQSFGLELLSKDLSGINFIVKVQRP